MANQLHIHIHTCDAPWRESAHPRAKNGEFGEASGGGKAAGKTASTVTLKGDELGDWASMKELRDKALEDAKRFIDKSFKNKATGNEIEVTKRGVKHTLHRASDTLARTVPAIPSLLESAHLLATAPDKRGDVNVLAVETYIAKVQIDGQQHNAILTVKKYSDGRRYYDHGIVK